MQDDMNKWNLVCHLLISCLTFMYSQRHLLQTPSGPGVKARPNDCNIIQHCWTMLHSVERGGQTNATCLMQYLDIRVWDLKLPRILRKQTQAILICPKNGGGPLHLRVGASSRFSWSYSLTDCLALSLSI